MPGILLDYTLVTSSHIRVLSFDKTWLVIALHLGISTEELAMVL